MKKILKRITAVCLGLIIAVSAAAPASAAWQKDSAGRWIYTTSVGSRVTGWQKIDNTWYYFNSTGVMQTGWQKIDNTWYYFNSTGVMQTGWQKIDGVWYYLRDGGSMVTGWQKINSVWYFFDGSGAMRTGWLLNGGKWYFLSGSGAMHTGWLLNGGQWYLLDSSGAMVTGWASVNGKSYYLTDSGAMAVGNVTIDGVSCTFDQSGALQQGSVTGSAVEQQMLAQVNLIRAQEGLPALQLSRKLCDASVQRAEERAEMGTLAHTRPDGSKWWTILSEYGISNLSGSAENLARGMDTADATVKAWMESASHKEAILGNYRYAGIGSSVKDGVVYWAMLFSGSDTAKDS